jgi:hypothetical protein
VVGTETPVSSHGRPGAPTGPSAAVQAPSVADPVPRRRSAPSEPEPLTPYNTVTDIRCTRTGCGRVVRDVGVFEALTAHPCPLCARCWECRGLCAHGLVDHELDAW